VRSAEELAKVYPEAEVGLVKGILKLQRMQQNNKTAQKNG
jgi:hypothetical protein